MITTICMHVFGKGKSRRCEYELHPNQDWGERDGCGRAGA